MTSHTNNALPALILGSLALALAGCGAEPAEGPREQIIVAEPGKAASATPAESGEVAPDTSTSDGE